jgi:hypothetical protein
MERRQYVHVGDHARTTLRTDHGAVRRRRCDCGTGEYIIYRCTRDDEHKRSIQAVTESYELDISCETCFNAYAHRIPIIHDKQLVGNVRLALPPMTDRTPTPRATAPLEQSEGAVCYAALRIAS